MVYAVIALFSKEKKFLFYFLNDQLRESCLVTRILLITKFSQYLIL